MRLLLHSFAAASVAVSFCTAASGGAVGQSVVQPAVQTIGDVCAAGLPGVESAYIALRDSSRRESSPSVVLAVDLAAGGGLEIDADGAYRYPMYFNDVAEGWSWRPQARPEDEDYYRWKYLPLASHLEERGHYVQEEKIGTPQETRVQWRYDYFLVFDNPQDFYARRTEESGFSGRLSRPSGSQGDAHPSLRLLAVLAPDETQPPDSTTFWKAVHARPVDFTLRKRYLAGKLRAIVICDGEGEIGRLDARSTRAAAGAGESPEGLPDQR